MARRIDGWLVGWLAVAVWCACLVLAVTRTGLGSELFTAVFWTGAVISAAHFGLSYHLAYAGGLAAARARPVVLLVAPLALGVGLAALVAWTLAAGRPAATASLTGALITVVYLMTTWHYVKQVYGVGRIGAAYAGLSLREWDVRILRYALYPLWFVGAAQVLLRGRSYELAGFRYGFSVLPVPVFNVLEGFGLLAMLPIAALFVRLRARTGSWPPSLLVAPYVAALLWIGLPPSPVWTILFLAPFHALQYLAVGHRAELALADPRRRGPVWWLNIFAGAACGGLLLSRWVPQWLDHQAGTTGGPLLFAAAFFVFLNLHHYLIDASIWRSGGSLVRAMVRRRDPAPEPAGELVAG